MMKQLLSLALAVLLIGLSACQAAGLNKTAPPTEPVNDISRVPAANQRVIYLAGGCFWGVEAYFDKIPGTLQSVVGYANGQSEDTIYRKIAQTDHAEVLELTYDKTQLSLEEVLLHYFRIIDPKAVNRQGNDIGRQYRTGIYYREASDRPVIDKVMQYQTDKLGEIAVEVEELTNFVVAEDYHQDYLAKNPNGYCHVDLNLADQPLFDTKYTPLSQETAKQQLDGESYQVIFHDATEKPFSSPLDKEFGRGIYVDKISGQPLFASQDKYDAGCGWPSFSKPILTGTIKQLADNSLGMRRTEVRTEMSDAHLGHVFDDGPKDLGGLRYCINGASLEFIPYDEMDEAGYGDYKVLVE